MEKGAPGGAKKEFEDFVRVMGEEFPDVVGPLLYDVAAGRFEPEPLGKI